MKYLESALFLRSMVLRFNNELLEKTDEIKSHPNYMRLAFGNGNTKDIIMDSFCNEFVCSTLSENENSSGFVITDLVTMQVNNMDMTYILYKAYHCEIEKGMVFYQVLNPVSMIPEGEIQFSNIEDNIFYNPLSWDVEESSCNAIENKKDNRSGKSIVFLIGHMDEKRLVYDIQRLIFDTVHNVAKHSSTEFNFLISINRFGGKASMELKNQVEDIDLFFREKFKPQYHNCSFDFVFEEEGGSEGTDGN